MLHNYKSFIMSLHFKFRSAVEYDSVNIEGHFISVIDLKEKIIEAKNLGKGSDFDLLITNAQTGDEYTDDGFLVPKNTSVIIKRVPATRAKPILRVDDKPKSLTSEQTGTEFTRGLETAPLPPSALPDVTYDGMDDFGVDLYAIPEPQPSKIDFDEDSRFTAVVNKTATDWQRQTQEAYASGGGRGFGRLGYGRGAARGRGYGRAIPPQGYVCHRCSQPGHFIQHCPTNGDPSYDMRRVKLPVGIPKTRLKADQEGGYILPDGSVAVMQPDESVFAKEANALLSIRPTSTEPPPELRCPLCQAIFKDAVMIPCCHYSFCDKCIRQELISKGKCPQCGSIKFRNDDLLPNIALRQAIDRFLETQGPTISADEGPKPQPVPDVEPPKPKAPARLQIELRKPAPSSAQPATTDAVEKEASPVITAEPVTDFTAAVSEKTNPADAEMDANANGSAEAGASVVVVPCSAPQNSEVVAVQSSKTDENVSDVHHTIVNDVSDVVKGGGMDPVIDDGGGMVNKLSEPPSNKEAEGVAVESEVSKGKKKKKRARVIAGDGAGDYMGAGKGKRMQGDRFCYICGSPEHLARDCLENPELAHQPHPGMFGPGPPVMPPYGPDMYWQGPQMPQHGRPFPVPYGEGMYGPGPMPFDGPMMPPGPYNMGPYMPPIYQAAPMHGGFMGGGMPAAMGPMERPLSREEFMEMQERERRRRLMHERLHRDWSPERSFSREGNWRPQTPESERRRYRQDGRGPIEDHQGLMRKRDLDRDSVRNYSDETDIYKKKTGNHDHKHASLVNSTPYRKNKSNSDDDNASFDELKSRKLQVEKHRHSAKSLPVSSKRESRHIRDEDVKRFSSEPEDDLVDQSYSARRYEKRSKDDDLPTMKLSRQSSKRPEETKSVHVSGSGGDSHSSRHRSRKNVVDGGKYDVDYEEEKGFVRSGKHVRGRSRSPEQVGRLRVNELSGSEVDARAHEEIREVEKPRRRKHHSHSKSKAELGPTVSESEEDLKKKKRKHKKHHDEGSLEKTRDGRTDADGDHGSKHRKHKSKNGSHGINSSSADLERTRWQLDSGHDMAITGHRSKHSKHRRSDNGKVK